MVVCLCFDIVTEILRFALDDSMGVVGLSIPSFGITGQAKEYIVHRFYLELLFQLPRGIERLDVSVHHDADTVAILRFVHVVGGYKDRNASVGCLVDEFPKLPSGDGIHTPCRFVEEDDLGSWKMLSEKASFCFHPSGSDLTIVFRSL